MQNKKVGGIFALILAGLVTGGTILGSISSPKALQISNYVLSAAAAVAAFSKQLGGGSGSSDQSNN